MRTKEDALTVCGIFLVAVLLGGGIGAIFTLLFLMAVGHPIWAILVFAGGITAGVLSIHLVTG